MVLDHEGSIVMILPDLTEHSDFRIHRINGLLRVLRQNNEESRPFQYVISVSQHHRFDSDHEMMHAATRIEQMFRTWSHIFGNTVAGSGHDPQRTAA